MADTGFPAYTVEGAQVYIVDKQAHPTKADQEVFIDVDGRKFEATANGSLAQLVIETAVELTDEETAAALAAIEEAAAAEALAAQEAADAEAALIAEADAALAAAQAEAEAAALELGTEALEAADASPLDFPATDEGAAAYEQAVTHNDGSPGAETLPA